MSSRGESWRSRIGDVLHHVVHHGAHHRGQVAHLLRTGGEEPAYTDFVHCVRSGLLPDEAS